MLFSGIVASTRDSSGRAEIESDCSGKVGEFAGNCRDELPNSERHLGMSRIEGIPLRATPAVFKTDHSSRVPKVLHVGLYTDLSLFHHRDRRI